MNKELCTQAYNDVVDYSARLAAYATSSFQDKIGHGHYEFRIKQIATRDVVFLAISVRRIAELTKTKGYLKGRKISSFTYGKEAGEYYFQESPNTYNLWETIGNIIHGNLIEVMFNDVDLSIFFDANKRSADELYRLVKSRKSIMPIILIKSDRGDLKYFKLFKFIKEIVDFTDHIDDILADNKIYVGLGYE